MTTRRMIDPVIWQSETMARLTHSQRLLFIGLFSNADDQGRLRAHPALIRSTVFPFDDISLDQIEADLGAIERVGSIILYKADGKTYLQITGWWRYQAPQWAYPSDIPAPDEWEDRRRYRKNNQIFTYNWPDGKPDTEPAGFSQEAVPSLPKDLPKPLPKDYSQGHSSRDSINDNNGESPSTPQLETDGADAPPGGDDENRLLLKLTPSRRILKAKLDAGVFHPQGRRGPLKFPSVQTAEKFDATAERLNSNLEAAIDTALEQGCTSVVRVVNYIAKWQPNGGKHAHNHNTPRIRRDVPEYKVADPAAFHDQRQDDADRVRDGPG